MKQCPSCEFLNYPESYECLRCNEVFPIQDSPSQQQVLRVPYDPSFFLIQQIFSAYQNGSDMDLEDCLLDALEVLDKEKEKFAHIERQLQQNEDEGEAIHEVKTALADIESLLAEALEEEDWQSPDWEDWQSEITSAIEMLEVSSSEIHSRQSPPAPTASLSDLVG